MLKIYGRQRSRAARCLWVLEEISLPYTQVPIDTQQGQTRTAEFLALNPAGKVPVIDDDGFVLRESLAIVAYLVAKTGSSLWPNDERERAYINQWSSWAATELEVPLNQIFRTKRRASEKGEDVDPAFVADNLELAGKALKLLEDHLVGHRHVASDAFTLGDINAYTTVMLAPVFTDMTPYPAVREWMSRCSARPAWARVTALP